MTIKNIHIKHWVIGKRYICIQAVSPTKEKIAMKRSDVTCKNCMRILEAEVTND